MSTDLVALAKGKLSDPTLLDWALHHYRDALKGGARTAEAVAAMERDWFDAASLGPWLGSLDSDLLMGLLLDLPARLFAPVAGALAGCWPRWRGDLAFHAAAALARADAELAWQCFSAPPGRRYQDASAAMGVLRALPLLPPERARPLLDAIVAAHIVNSPGDGPYEQMLIREALQAARRLDRDTALRLLRIGLPMLGRTGRAGWLLEALEIGSSEYRACRNLASNRREGRDGQTFAGLAALFGADAPLAELDRLSLPDAKLPDLMDLVERHVAADDLPLLRTAYELLSAAPALQQRAELQCFLVGAVATACGSERPAIAALDLSETLRLLAADLPYVPYTDALLDRLRGFRSTATWDALLAAFESARETYGSVNLAPILAELGGDLAIDPLIRSLDDDSGDFLAEAAQSALVALGEPALARLVEQWERLDASQRIYGVSVIAEVGAGPAVDFALQALDGPLELEDWSRLAQSAPTVALLERLESLLESQDPSIDETFYIGSRLLDRDHPALPAIDRRLREARARVAQRRALFGGGPPIARELALPLRCPDCGAEDLYWVRRVAVEPGERKAQRGFVLAAELLCAACGACSDLKLTAEAESLLVAEIAKREVATDRQVGALLVRIEVPFKGRRHPVGEVIRHCEQNLERDPDSVPDLVRLADCFRVALKRPGLAWRWYERAVALDPTLVEAQLALAERLAETDRGVEALPLLDGALAHRGRWRFVLTDVRTPAETVERLAGLYNGLIRATKDAQRSPLAKEPLAAPKKVGRNDPCPCGSGKKFKKCCMEGG